MNTGWTKLFSSIVTSSVWCEDDATLRVWVAMLALCDAQGHVEGSPPGMASLCRMDVPTFEAAVRKLTAPDPYSRTPDHEGRRLQVVPGGWQILNHGLYRARGQDKPGSKAAAMRRLRARRAGNSGEHVTPGYPDTDTETDTEASVGREGGGNLQEDQSQHSPGQGSVVVEGPRPARLLAGVRQDRELEALRLAREIAAREGGYADQVLMDASEHRGNVVSDPAGMSDARLMQTLNKLRRRAGHRPEGDTPQLSPRNQGTAAAAARFAERRNRGREGAGPPDAPGDADVRGQLRDGAGPGRDQG